MSSVIELNANEKINLELVESISMKTLANKLENRINVFHIYKKGEYHLVNVFPDGSLDCEDFVLDKKCKIILENGNSKTQINLDFKANISDVDDNKPTDAIDRFLTIHPKEGELKHWSAESIQTINIPHEKMSVINGKFRELGFGDFGSNGEKFLQLIEECSSSSTTGNISFRFFFMEGKTFLKSFHYQMFLILKKFIEKLIVSHNNFKESHYVLDVFVFVVPMKEKHLGSAMIHKYVKNEENDLILPTKAVMKINQRFLSSNAKDEINCKLIQTLFHEMLHCLGFGYWDLFGKNMTAETYKVNNIEISNIMNYEKTVSIYRNLLKTNSLQGIPLTKDMSHFSTYNRAVLKDGKLFGVLPGMKYELMGDNDTGLNVFSKLTASVIEGLGYQVNYNLCDEYIYSPLPHKLEINYTKPSENHYAKGLEKYVVILQNGQTKLSGIDTYCVNENTEYVINNRHSYSVYVVSALEDDEKYLLGEKEGVYYNDTNVVISPNNRTPNLFYIVSSITFAGVPIIKVQPNAVNSKNCYNHNSLKRLMEEFVSGKSPRLQ